MSFVSFSRSSNFNKGLFISSARYKNIFFNEGNLIALEILIKAFVVSFGMHNIIAYKVLINLVTQMAGVVKNLPNVYWLYQLFINIFSRY